MKENLAAAGSLALTCAGWLIAQADVSSIPVGIGGLITQAGGLGLAVWLVYHHTTITIPTMQKLHAEERLQAHNDFQKTVDDKREEYFREIDRQRAQFADVLARASCKFKGQE